jgi:FkbM family methyltransferase
MMNRIGNLFRRARFVYLKSLNKAPKVKVQIKQQTERHGSSYGGWNIIKNSLSSDSIVYSFGIGEDISFDISLIEKYNVEILAFDPTPKVKQWLANQKLPSKFKYYELALADKNGLVDFFLPENPDYISHSIIKTNKNSIKVPAKKLSSIMSDLRNDKIDVLKIDIEGAEYAVLHNVLKEKLNITQILVEFHHFFEGISVKDTENIIKQMNEAGYKIFYISPNGFEYSFLKQ